MDNLNKILYDEIDDFRDLGYKFLNKQITSQEFKSKSGGMGVYAQRGGERFMIRLRIPSGVLSIEKFKLVYKLAQKYNLDNIHLTTRQAIQLHNLQIDEICNIMREALENGIYTRGGGGNFPRNVALSPLSGVEKGEAFDVTEYALLVNNYFMEKIYSYKLPRKLKVAFSNSSTDYANTTLTDLGFMAVIENGVPFFKMYLAGGLGQNPSIGIIYDELVPVEDVLYHVEAMTQLFIEQGDYKNKSKARTRYILSRMGKETFLECYKKHFKFVKDSMSLDSISSKEIDISIQEENLNYKKESNIIEQKQKGLYTLILYPVNGQLYLNDMLKILEFLEKHESADIRLSMEESLYIRNLTLEQSHELLNIVGNLNNSTLFERSISCIGVPTCQMGIEKSQLMLNNILEYFKEKDFKSDFLPTISISGCSNSCSRHQVSEIGLSGKKIKFENEFQDAFEIHIGGNRGNFDTHLGKIYGSILSKDIPPFLYELALNLESNNISFKSYILEKENDFINIINKYLIL